MAAPRQCRKLTSTILQGRHRVELSDFARPSPISSQEHAIPKRVLLMEAPHRERRVYLPHRVWDPICHTKSPRSVCLYLRSARTAFTAHDAFPGLRTSHSRRPAPRRPASTSRPRSIRSVPMSPSPSVSRQATRPPHDAAGPRASSAAGRAVVADPRGRAARAAPRAARGRQGRASALEPRERLGQRRVRGGARARSSTNSPAASGFRRRGQVRSRETSATMMLTMPTMERARARNVRDKRPRCAKCARRRRATTTAEEMDRRARLRRETPDGWCSRRSRPA